MNRHLDPPILFYSFTIAVSGEAPNTNNARLEIEDALSTYQHRLQQYQHQETTQNSVFNALNDVVSPAVHFANAFPHVSE